MIVYFIPFGSLGLFLLFAARSLTKLKTRLQP